MFNQNTNGPQGSNDTARFLAKVAALATRRKTYDMNIIGEGVKRIPLPETRLQVSILPGKNPGRPLRAQWERETPRILAVLDDDHLLGGCRGPEGFHHATLVWAIRASTCVVLWECGCEPRIMERVTARLAEHKNTTLIFTNRGYQAKWTRMILKYQRPGTMIDFLYAMEG